MCVTHFARIPEAHGGPIQMIFHKDRARKRYPWIFFGLRMRDGHPTECKGVAPAPLRFDHSDEIPGGLSFLSLTRGREERQVNITPYQGGGEEIRQRSVSALPARFARGRADTLKLEESAPFLVTFLGALPTPLQPL